MKTVLVCLVACALSGCVSIEKLDRKLPPIDADEIDLTVKSTLLGTGRIHAEGLRNDGDVKTADVYHASLDIPGAGSVEFRARNYRRKLSSPAAEPVR